MPKYWGGNCFLMKKQTDFHIFFLHAQHSVTEPGPTPSPWSITIKLDQQMSMKIDAPYVNNSVRLGQAQYSILECCSRVKRFNQREK